MIAALLSAFTLMVQTGTEPPEATPRAEAIEPVSEAAPEPASDLEAYIDGLAAAHLAQAHVPGIVISVVRDGEVAVSKGYGVVDIETGTPATGSEVRFEIGSISKTFTWTAVMMLVEEGRLDLSEDVNTYLADYQVPEAERALTLADLMSHRTGLEDSLAIFLPEFAALERSEALARTEPGRAHARGETTSYSNWGSALAAQIVEDVSGMSYRDFLHTRILEPLEMNDTTFREGERREDQPPLSASYKPENGWLTESEHVDIGAFAPAGAIASTAEDMARWMQFHLGRGELDGVRLLSEESYQAMRSRLYPDRAEGADLAHGFMERWFSGILVYGHGGALNDFFSNMAIAPELDAGIFISQNGSASTDPIRRMPDLILARLMDEAGYTAPEPGPVADAETLAEDAAGQYLSNRRAYSGLEKAFALSGVTTVAAHDGTIVLNQPGQSVRYVPVAQDVWENRLGERIVFIRDDEGEIIRFADAAGVHTYDRIDASSNPVLLFAGLGLALFFALTTWLGLWRRLGRDQQVTGLGRLLSISDLAIAGLVFAFAATLVAATVTLSNIGLEMVFDYPPAPLELLLLLGTLLAIAAGLAVVMSLPVFTASGWSLWRKGHHVLFAGSLVFLAWGLFTWGLAFSGHAGA